jgi:Yip1 domain
MGLVDRAKNICITPKTEWPVIAGETTSTGSLMSGYVAPLAIIGPIAGFIGGSIIGHTMPFIGTWRTPIVAGVGLAIFTFVMAFVGVFILSLIIDALAPSFGGEKNSQQALKVAVYSYTPAWIAGILSIIPFLGMLAIFAALYALYLLYLGLPRLMKCPEDKSIGYTVVVVICAIVLSVVISLVGGTIVGAGAVATGAFGGRSAGSSVQFDKDSPVGKLEQFGKSMEEAGKKMEAAQKSGNQEEAAKAAMAGLGVVLGGGKAVEAVDIEKLKPLVPETFAGLAKKSSRSDKSGAAGFMVSKTEAEYADTAGKSVQLEITDMGSARALMGLASWANLQGEKEDQYGTEKTQKVNGRLVHEKSRKSGGGEYSVVIADRFMVDAKSSSVDLGTLKSAVGSLDLGKLEAMKDEGVTK